MKNADALRTLPSVEAILGDERVAPLLGRIPRRLALMVIRKYLTEVRESLLGDNPPISRKEIRGLSPDFDWAILLERLERQARPSLRRAINALGVVLHTGLGRAALSKPAQTALSEVSENFCTLAIELETGRRGERYAHVADLLCELTGAEAAMVVNNNAAATMLVLNTLAEGKEVIISRGQLVEIGGAFRMPDIIKRSNVRMVEVGTTNRTHLKDYRSAITPETGMLIRVHMSNYKIVGFTKEVGIADLVALGRESGLAVVDDLGSGALIDLSKYGLPKEPMVQESLAAGADIVCFSGDKLIGGPQSGIIVGRKALIDRMKQNPLTRTLRCGKLTYAALEATLRMFFDEERLVKEHAVLGALAKPLSVIERQSNELIAGLGVLGGKLMATIEDGISEIGGGSLPGESLPTKLVVLKPKGMSAEELGRRLRLSDPAVFGRIESDRLLLDLRTVRDDEIALIVRALRAALGD
jgi:L-seryl-tRNA(Ser) seleniumtransferase